MAADEDKKIVILYGVFTGAPAYDKLVVVYPTKERAEDYFASGYPWLYATRLVSAAVDWNPPTWTASSSSRPLSWLTTSSGIMPMMDVSMHQPRSIYPLTCSCGAAITDTQQHNAHRCKETTR